MVEGRRVQFLGQLQVQVFPVVGDKPAELGLRGLSIHQAPLSQGPGLVPRHALRVPRRFFHPGHLEARPRCRHLLLELLPPGEHVFPNLFLEQLNALAFQRGNLGCIGRCDVRGERRHVPGDAR